ncbi:SNF2 family N-terminal domain-containing protein [Radiomyces spectabilis]|uniref:SNF2 family N-terminal domain-containing protein n=1 Tax=Radiomyces spectabilis TaxID=64574 RepID=UPI00221E9C1B|nr:SNF2 family N-terminal domain-containing protein [Radiomyces spectabilis]KAI8374307.1 SNF2 family N-terminal domain-containing protein [Radiomyces spectabilis]
MNAGSTEIMVCTKCREGCKNTYRLVVRSRVDAPGLLFHAHRDDSLQAILLRLCDQFPREWSRNVVYYFYVDMGGTYYETEDAFWLRDKDQLLVSPTEDVSLLPDVSLNAVHASLRPDIELRTHQEEGVQRMIRMERMYRGGILADDMGLGKTLQMLCVMMRQQPKLNIRAPTLVVVPSRGVAEQWAEEIRTKTTYGSLPYFIYGEETCCLLEQSFFRVVITTYDRLRAEYKNRHYTNAVSPLIDTDWHRVVLDESNKIKTLRSLVTESVLELKSKYRWCLTGTPLQNELSELYPIFQFLDITIPKSMRQDVSYMTELLQKHMIRRTKQRLQSTLSILPRQEQRVVLEFSPAERALYDYLERLLYHQISRWRNSNQEETARTASTLLYLRLKQACSHHQLLLRKFPDLIPTVQQGEDMVCETLGITAGEENERAFENDGDLAEVFDIIESFYDQFASVENMPDFEALQQLPFIQHSTKVAWLIGFLKKTLSASNTDKIVVVTQFADFLQLISSVLSSIDIKHNCYHGDMSNTSRTISLRQFNHNAEVRVMLLSLKAGGVGLNLQRANYMVLLDRWWNPGIWRSFIITN